MDAESHYEPCASNINIHSMQSWFSDFSCIASHSANDKQNSKGWRPKTPYRQSRKPVSMNISKLKSFSEVKSVEGTRKI
jgi:hypothetical protein